MGKNMNNFNISALYPFFVGNESNFDIGNYYDISEFYEVETFRVWEKKFETVKVLNKIFLAVSIVIVIINFLLLFTILSTRVRRESASWYLYHLNFVTILQVIFSLPRLEASLHETFGTCMFFTFTEWALTLEHYVNIVLMDMEILANIFASDPKWRNNPKRRFYISIALSWILCILISVIVVFFGHDEHHTLPICFNLNKTSQIFGHVLKNLLPFVFTTGLMIAGITLFIRSKRSPESYKHLAQYGIRNFNEWFVCFLVWNSFIAFGEILAHNIHIHVATLDFVWEVTFQMIIFLLHVGLPVSCLLLQPVRTTCEEWTMAVYQYMTGRNRRFSTNSPDIHLLRVESSEDGSSAA